MKVGFACICVFVWICDRMYLTEWNKKYLRAEANLEVYITTESILLCFVDRASMHNLVNKANLAHNLLLVYLSNSTCFGRLSAHHQEKQLCLGDTSYLLFCVDDCLVCRVEWMQFHSTLHTRQSSTQNNKYQVLHKHSCFSWWWAHNCPKHVEIDKYTKKNLLTKLALFTTDSMLRSHAETLAVQALQIHPSCE